MGGWGGVCCGECARWYVEVLNAVISKLQPEGCSARMCSESITCPALWSEPTQHQHAHWAVPPHVRSVCMFPLCLFPICWPLTRQARLEGACRQHAPHVPSASLHLGQHGGQAARGGIGSTGSGVGRSVAMCYCYAFTWANHQVDWPRGEEIMPC